MGELKRLDRKSIDKNRIDIARLLGIPSGGIIVNENGRIYIHNIPEDDARRYSNILRNKVKDIRLIPGKYDFRKVPLPGQVPGRLVTISGMLKDSLNEGHQIQKYKGYELDWNDDNVDPEEGTADFSVYIRKNGKELTNKRGSVLTFNGFREARKYVDSIATPCSAYDKSRQIKALIDNSTGGDVVSLTKSGNKSISVIYNEHSPFEEDYRWYLTDDFQYSLIRYEYIFPSEFRGEYYSDEAKEWTSSHLGFVIEDDINDDDKAPALILKYVLTHPLEETPFTDTGIGLDNFIDALDKYYGLLGVNDITQEDIDRLKDECDASIPEHLAEAKKKRKKKRLGGTLNPDAGNVEHNINMFNHMNSPTGGPSNNPVSGPFGGDVSAPSVGGCCEAFEKSKKELIEGMRLTNGMREDEHYYFDDGNYSYHFFSKQDLYGITNQFAVLVVDYGFEFHYDKMYRDEKSNMDVIPTSMRHERPKKICYFEFDEDTQPDIVDAFLDDDMNAFREAVKEATEKEISKSGLMECSTNAAKSDRLVEVNINSEKYYMAKYRGVNTDRLHKVYFSCEGNFEDAENLLDALIAEPYTDARVLGTVSPAAAERDGFTKIGGTSNKELDDDFNMSTRTLW